MRNAIRILMVAGVLVLGLAGMASGADEAAAIDSGDTAWLIVATALVMLMTPGLAFFYGGMVRRKNVLGTIMHSFMMLCAVSIVWILWGYTLAFGPDKGGFIGGLDMLGLRGVGMEAQGTVPQYIFMMFQGMFAIITPALITGAFAERMKFGAMLLFSVLWVTLVYAPVCHWVWGGGWIATKIGALDFAGGTVVHINSAVAALVAALVIGQRKGYLEAPMAPHNLTMTVLGAALLWFGWFGFNAGSALASNGQAALAFVTTNTGAAAAALGWSFTEWMHRGKATAFGTVSGAVAGLVAITPAAGFVSPMSAILIGFGAGFLCYFAVSLRPKLGYDDSLDVVGIHGVGGIWGAIATGIFADAAMGGADGLLHGNPGLVWSQFVAVAATIAYSGVMSLVLLKAIDLTVGLRVSEEDEMKGLDLSQHGETGYEM
jgi:Amt family ammonium transporter